VAFFPADHHLADEMQFARAVDGAFDVVHKHPDLLVLLGAKAEKAQVEYGWIEPGKPIANDRSSSPFVFRVNRFWEKPSEPIAQTLLSRGCLWNTFVLAGRARTFLDILESTIPNTLSCFDPVATSSAKEEEEKRASVLYEALPTGDFSHEVLTQCPERLAVLRMDDAGWGTWEHPKAYWRQSKARRLFRTRLRTLSTRG
jgi:mannose-1-phosphate guanylyltransferase